MVYQFEVIFNAHDCDITGSISLHRLIIVAAVSEQVSKQYKEANGCVTHE